MQIDSVLRVLLDYSGKTVRSLVARDPFGDGLTYALKEGEIGMVMFNDYSAADGRFFYVKFPGRLVGYFMKAEEIVLAPQAQPDDLAELQHLLATA